MNDNPFGYAGPARSSGKPLFVLGGILLVVAIASLAAMTIMLVNAGMNVDPEAEGLVPGQSKVFGPAAALIGLGLLSFLGGIFSLMIGAKRMMRSGSDGGDREERLAA